MSTSIKGLSFFAVAAFVFGLVGCSADTVSEDSDAVGGANAVSSAVGRDCSKNEDVCSSGTRCSFVVPGAQKNGVAYECLSIQTKEEGEACRSDKQCGELDCAKNGSGKFVCGGAVECSAPAKVAKSPHEGEDCSRGGDEFCTNDYTLENVKCAFVEPSAQKNGVAYECMTLEGRRTGATCRSSAQCGSASCTYAGGTKVLTCGGSAACLDK